MSTYRERNGSWSGGRAGLADPVDLHRLAVFYTLVNAGTMSRASERLYITQPAISAHIKALEMALGVSLFNRVGRRSVVSAAGTVLYGRAEQLLSVADELKAAMEDIRGIATGRLTLGASVVWQYHLPGALVRFKREYPHVELSTQVANSDLIERLVLDRSVDIGFIARSSERSELAAKHLADDDVVPVCASDNALADAARPDVDEPGGEFLIVREAGSATRRATDTLIAALERPVSIYMELGAQEAIEQVVIAGEGIGVVSRVGAEARLRAGVLAIAGITGLTSTLRLHVIYLRRKKLTATQKAFLELIESDGALTG